MGREGDAEDNPGGEGAGKVFLLHRSIDGPERESDEKRRRHVVFQIVRVANVEVRHRHEKGGGSTRELPEVLGGEPFHNDDGSEGEEHVDHSAGEVEIRWILEEPRLERAEALVSTEETAGDEEPTHHGEEEIEEEAGIEVVLRVEAPRHGERPRHDVRFVGIVDEGKVVTDTVEPERRRENQNGGERQTVRSHQLVRRCSMTRSRIRSRLTWGSYPMSSRILARSGIRRGMSSKPSSYAFS